MTSIQLTAHDHAHHWRSIGIVTGAAFLLAIAAATQTPQATAHALTGISSGIAGVTAGSASADVGAVWLAPIQTATDMVRLVRQLERDPVR